MQPLYTQKLSNFSTNKITQPLNKKNHENLPTKKNHENLPIKKKSFNLSIKHCADRKTLP